MSYNSSEMKKILFIFSTTDGHTHKITQSIAADFADECDTTLKKVDDTTAEDLNLHHHICLLYTSPSPRDAHESRMPSSA